MKAENGTYRTQIHVGEAERLAYYYEVIRFLGRVFNYEIDTKDLNIENSRAIIDHILETEA